MSKGFKMVLVILWVGVLLGVGGSAQAATSSEQMHALTISVEALENSLVHDDFVLGPGKEEVALDPGEETVKFITITNRFAEEKEFVVANEDFKGSRNLGESIVLLGTDKGPYSLKDYLIPAATTFRLKQGERATLPILIRIPKDATPGGLFGAVIVGTQSVVSETIEEEEKAGVGVSIYSRLANLFFVRVNGPIVEDGSLLDFYSNKKFYSSPHIKLTALFENRSTVHLNPFGFVRVKNMLGAEVDGITVEPYFVMPDSIRDRAVNIDRPFMFGRYKAELSLNRGYNNLTDEKTITFWVLPWKTVLEILIGIFLVVAVLLGVKKWHDMAYEKKPKAPRK
ncbi:hypothetical protein KKA13_00930 [Patescibacteria group bacterium]|nr:hypothetical protein [Patescibacteria group bacterium]